MTIEDAEAWDGVIDALKNLGLEVTLRFAVKIQHFIVKAEINRITREMYNAE